MREGAFAGLRVLELATGISGPYAARFLADQGADVVKVEPPDGDPYRADPGFQALNRNKRSVVAPDGSGLRERLLGHADAVVVPDAAAAHAARSKAPDAVVVSFPVWGTGSPAAAGPSSPGAVAAATGIGWNQLSYGEGPVHVVLPLAGYGAGMLGALAVAAGLYARQTTGRAPTYEVSDVAGAGAMQIGDVAAPDLDAARDAARDGSSPLGSAGRAPAYRLFEAADRRWLFVACGTTAFYESMLAAVGRRDLLDDPRLPSPPWGLLDAEPLAFITPVLEAAFAGRTRAEWLDVLAEHDVPCQPVQTRAEFTASSTAAANGLDVYVEHRELGTVAVPPQPLRLSECPAVEPTAAPLLGEHTDEVLAEAERLGPGPSRSGAPSRPPAAERARPLAGVTAVDLSSFIAGPVVTRHLAMLGADVVKVEPPAGDPFRALGPYFNGWNQGKRSIALDLKLDADRGVLHGLVAGADVVVENFRPGVAERLGCSQEQLRAVRPDLVTVRSPGYGDDESMAHLAAFDPLLQALGGIMDAQGGDGDPVFLSVPVHDAATPLIAAFGVVAALWHRARGGPGQEVLTSLVRTTTAVQAAEMVRYDGRPATARGGFDFRGDPDGAGGGYVETGTGWVWREPLPADADEGTPPDVPVCTVGFVGSPHAAHGGHVAEHPDTEWGLLHQVGQLVAGAGPQPTRAPRLDEHRDELLAEARAAAGAPRPAPPDPPDLPG